MSYSLGFESLILAVILCLQLVYAQNSDSTTAQPPTGLMTVDYIIIGVTSAAGAFCIGLIIYVVISSSKASKKQSKVENVKVDHDKQSMVSSKSSKSSRSSRSGGKGHDNPSAKLND